MRPHFELGRKLAPLAPLADRVLEGGGPVPAGLNDIIRGAAAAHNAVVAETAPLIGVEDLVGGTDCLHRTTPATTTSRMPSLL
jgi:hypothetical protein